ncbi:DUF4362 domain-containing protein [Alkalicoccus daliensis]|uniref:DUF4362 domain-containing protein n=1 Tax=Alkalicoccus daliensis TaxID=745820 RepID=A0A1H0CS17_9BACI|nr:DUF4362 domain-containing protein [Alkalicoccus daliensis]SDN60692.1 protein of unknown function [Alkalicoccus daliensis]
MKKITFSIVLLLIFFIAGCQNTEYSSAGNQEEHTVSAYTPSAEDVVDMHGEIENEERFKQFLNHVEEEKKDNLRLVRYTTEGDPILYDLAYDAGEIKLTMDSRRDEYGEGSITTATCNSIQTVETGEGADYILENCQDTTDQLILITLE